MHASDSYLSLTGSEGATFLSTPACARSTPDVFVLLVFVFVCKDCVEIPEVYPEALLC